MDSIKLKLSDSQRQTKLETIIMQLGFSIKRRSVSEDALMPPLLTYRLEGRGDTSTLEDTIPRIGYGFTQPPMQKVQGSQSSLTMTVRQLVPTDTAKTGGLKTFGDDGL